MRVNVNVKSKERRNSETGPTCVAKGRTFRSSWQLTSVAALELSMQMSLCLCAAAERPVVSVAALIAFDMRNCRTRRRVTVSAAYIRTPPLYLQGLPGRA
jgi:hypothetical protein